MVVDDVRIWKETWKISCGEAGYKLASYLLPEADQGAIGGHRFAVRSSSVLAESQSLAIASWFSLRFRAPACV